MSPQMPTPELIIPPQIPTKPLRKFEAIYQLKNTPQPVFRPGNSLKPLSTAVMYEEELTEEIRVELADHWGYCLYFGRLSKEVLLKMDNPVNSHGTVYRRVCELAKANPKKYPLHVIIDPRSSLSLNDNYKILPDGKHRGQTWNPGQTWTCDDQGEIILAVAYDKNGNPIPHDQQDWGGRIFSPEAPDTAFTMIADYEVSMLEEVLQRAPIAVLTNLGEYGTTALGNNRDKNNDFYWEKDPVIRKAKGHREWWDYLSERKTHQEMIITNRLKLLLPDPTLYIYFYTEACPSRCYHPEGCTDCNDESCPCPVPNWMDFCWDYTYFHTTSDLPNTGDKLYWGEEAHWSGNSSLLTGALNATAQQIAVADPDNGKKPYKSYNWMSAGWDSKMSDSVRYLGYLKCYYTAGMIGGVAGYYGIVRSMIDHWIWQLMELGQVHALFSHLDTFVQNSKLLEGPKKHCWSHDFSAYEFPTGQENVRVVVRKHRERLEWLLTAWAAAEWAADIKEERQCEVEVPELGKVVLKARGTGAVYHAIIRDHQPFLTLIDECGEYPTRGMTAAYELK